MNALFIDKDKEIIRNSWGQIKQEFWWVIRSISQAGFCLELLEHGHPLAHGNVEVAHRDALLVGGDLVNDGECPRECWIARVLKSTALDGFLIDPFHPSDVLGLVHATIDRGLSVEQLLHLGHHLLEEFLVFAEFAHLFNANGALGLRPQSSFPSSSWSYRRWPREARPWGAQGMRVQLGQP